ncbi:MAG: terminase [Geminicoccaceae bacterium]
MNYSPSSLEQLPTEDLRKIALSVARNRLEQLDHTQDQIGDWRWRLNNLYWIIDKQGNRVQFKTNTAQERLLNDLHHSNVILKARQLGFSTLIQLIMLDACVFNPNIRCGTIAHTRDAAEDIFAEKAKYPYENLPEGIRAENPATMDAARHLTFSNNSSIRVGTSLRSGTFQYLHISEYGKICAQYPEKAKEVKTGALNTVQAGQMIFIESTAEGQEGHFHQICQRAQAQEARGDKLTPLDFRMHFFPWWLDTGYVLPAGSMLITAEMREYFDQLEAEHGITLTPEQEAWYVAKSGQQDEDMFAEYPATPDEAFRATVEGAYYGKLIRKLEEQDRIGSVPHDTGLAVETWWDLGMADLMSIWFVQRQGIECRMIDFYQNSGEGLGHYARMLQEKQHERDFTYSRHVWPHDGNVRILDEKGRSRVQVMRDLGYEVEIAERGLIQTGIEAVRNLLPLCYFDAEHCDEGIKAMRMYRKEWDENLGTWKKTPLHDQHSHAADAFRTGASYAVPKGRRPGQRLAPRLALA